MKLKRSITILFVSVCLVLLISCSAGQKTQAYNPHFTWIPAQHSTSSSAQVTFAIINPVYDEGQSWALRSFPEFSTNLARSFDELLVSKGFTVKGPYNSLNALTFQDKKGSELAIYPSLSVYIKFLDSKWSMEFGSSLLSGLLDKNSPNNYKLTGNVVMGGQVSIIALEPLSGEKMWVKNIMLSDTVFQIESEKLFKGIGQNPPGDLSGFEVPAAYLIDNGLRTPIAMALENYYAKVLNTAQNYLDVEEMQSLKKQVEEIRSKKVY